VQGPSRGPRPRTASIKQTRGPSRRAFPKAVFGPSKAPGPFWETMERSSTGPSRRAAKDGPGPPRGDRLESASRRSNAVEGGRFWMTAPNTTAPNTSLRQLPVLRGRAPGELVCGVFTPESDLPVAEEGERRRARRRDGDDGALFFLRDGRLGKVDAAHRRLVLRAALCPPRKGVQEAVVAQNAKDARPPERGAA